MMEAFTTTLSQMMQILLLLLLGYAMNKLHVISREAEGILSRFVTVLFLPALLMYSNMIECKLDSLVAYGSWVLYGGFFFVASALVSYPLAKLLCRDDDYLRGVYRYALTFPNSGAVGTPLVLAMYGTAGMFQYGLFTLVGTVLTHSWGVANLQPSYGKTTLWSNLKKCINASSLGMVIGMILGLLGAKEWMPGFVVNTVYSLGQCYVVVGLLMVGFAVADYPFTALLEDKSVIFVTLYRLIILPAVFLLMLYVIKAPMMVAVMTVLCFAGPCGLYVVVYPALYHKDCRSGAGMLLLSNVGSMVTVPLMYALAQTVFGG